MVDGGWWIVDGGWGMAYQFPFEKLEAWQLTKDLVIKIYGFTRLFPESERFGLVSQIQRAAVSVASNLAEGASRSSKKDQAHFSQIAYGSLTELLCQLIIAKELGYLPDDLLYGLRDNIELIARKISALRKYQMEG